MHSSMGRALGRSGRIADSGKGMPTSLTPGVGLRGMRGRVGQFGGKSDIQSSGANGPHPLAFDGEISSRYQELDLHLRQSHAERDLESLGRDLYEGGC
jgi:hypothetical protein